MKTKRFFIYVLATICFIISACDSNDTLEPYEMVDGCVFKYGTYGAAYTLTNIDGTPAFAGMTLEDAQGNKFDGSRLYVNVSAHPSVNGFFNIGEDGNYLLGKVDDQLVVYGPFEKAGHFFEDVVPVVAERGSITYITRQGEIAFHIEEVVGQRVMEVTEYMGGLSAFSIPDKDTYRLWGAVNTKGEMVIAPKYHALKYQGSGLWAAIDLHRCDKDNDYLGEIDMIDKSGTVRFTYKGKYEHVLRTNYGNQHDQYPFSGEYGIIDEYSTGEKRTVVVDRNGKEIMDNQSLYGYTHYKGNFVTYSESSRYDIIGADGEEKFKYSPNDDVYKLYDDYCITYDEGSGARKISLRKENGFAIKNAKTTSEMTRLKDHLFVYRDGAYIFFDAREPYKDLNFVNALSANFEIEEYKLITAAGDERMTEVPKSHTANFIKYQTNDCDLHELRFNVKSAKVYEDGYLTNTFEYDENGKLIDESADIKRDDQGRITSITWSHEEAGQWGNEYTYSEDGKLDSELYYSEYTDYTRSFYYNENGRVSSTYLTCESSGNESGKHEYLKFDEHGNWTHKRITYKNELHESEYSREIRRNIRYHY